MFGVLCILSASILGVCFPLCPKVSSEKLYIMLVPNLNLEGQEWECSICSILFTSVCCLNMLLLCWRGTSSKCAFFPWACCSDFCLSYLLSRGWDVPPAPSLCPLHYSQPISAETPCVLLARKTGHPDLDERLFPCLHKCLSLVPGLYLLCNRSLPHWGVKLSSSVGSYLSALAE